MHSWKKENQTLTSFPNSPKPDLLLLNGREYTFQTILSGDWGPLNNANEEAAIQFAFEWLGGQEIFKIRTSGSTGKPRQIRLTRKQLVTSALKTAEVLNLQPADKALVCISVGYIGGMMMMVRGFEIGMHMHITNPSASVFENIGEETFDFMAIVPLQLQRIIENKEASRLKAMKSILVGGAPVSGQLKKSLQNIEGKVLETYGMTETCSHIAFRKLNDPEKDQPFQALPGIMLTQDSRGCLIIEGDVTLGKRVVTNDVVDLKSPHQFQWIGRADRIINSGGIKISPEQLEAQLEAFFSRQNIQGRYFITGIPDQELGSKVALVWEGPTPNQTILDQLKAFSKKSLPHHHQPKTILIVDKFSETENGKVLPKESLRRKKESFTL